MFNKIPGRGGKKKGREGEEREKRREKMTATLPLGFKPDPEMEYFCFSEAFIYLLSPQRCTD